MTTPRNTERKLHDGMRVATPVLRWMLEDQVTIAGPKEFLHGMCLHIVEAGVPLARVAAFVRTLHPSIMGRRFLWSPEAGSIVTEAAYEFLFTDSFIKSPAAQVSRTGRPIRRRLVDPECPDDFVILDDLRREGMTDYLMTPLVFTNGDINSISWTSRAEEGFDDAQIAALEAISVALSRVTEIYALRRTAVSLLNTYLGRGAGMRVLQGQIRRGDTERIRAAIWLSDLRDFTSLSERLDGKDVIDLINAHFDCLVPTIEENGGEVLKFMGDGILAIFPLDDANGRTEAEICAGALAAARAAQRITDDRNTELTAAGAPALRFGVALHVGDVHYGNIGGASRLDFTAIGPAVNLAARLESLTKQSGRPVIVSADFAALCGDAVELLGRFELKGVGAPVTAFAPRS